MPKLNANTLNAKESQKALENNVNIVFQILEINIVISTKNKRKNKKLYYSNSVVFWNKQAPHSIRLCGYDKKSLSLIKFSL